MAISKLKNDETPMAATSEVSILSATTKELTDMSISAQISTINVPFYGDSLYLVSHGGEPQVPMRPVVEGMGLDWASQYTKIKQRFNTSVVMITMQLPGDNQRREVVCLNLRKLAGWLHTINVGKVRPELREKVARYQEECDDVLYQYWVNGEAKNPRKKTTVEERTPLRDAVNMLVGKKGLRYGDAYNMVHQRFDVDSIDELELDQIPQAVEYIHRVVLEGDYIGKQEELPLAPAQFTSDEICSLCWLWMSSSVMIKKIAEVEPLLRVAEHRLAGSYYSMPKEYSRTLESARKLLERETNDIKLGSFTDDNWRVLHYLRSPDKQLHIQ